MQMQTPYGQLGNAHIWNLQFSRQWTWQLLYSEMWRHVVWEVITSILEKPAASIFRLSWFPWNSDNLPDNMAPCLRLQHSSKYIPYSSTDDGYKCCPDYGVESYSST
jgi:hypothetical protein